MPSRRYRERPYVPAKDPLTAIPPSRHPFQFWVMFALAMSGLGNLFTPGSAVLQEGLDPFFHKLWAALLLISAAMALAASFWRDRVSGLLVERIALITMGSICPLYGIVVILQIGFTEGLIGISIMISAGIAALWRAVHVNRELKILRHFVTRNF